MKKFNFQGLKSNKKSLQNLYNSLQKFFINFQTIFKNVDITGFQRLGFQNVQ